MHYVKISDMTAATSETEDITIEKVEGSMIYVKEVRIDSIA